jgi:hypothetical protein
MISLLRGFAASLLSSSGNLWVQEISFSPELLSNEALPASNRTFASVFFMPKRIGDVSAFLFFPLPLKNLIRTYDSIHRRSPEKTDTRQLAANFFHRVFRRFFRETGGLKGPLDASS